MNKLAKNITTTTLCALSVAFVCAQSGSPKYGVSHYRERLTQERDSVSMCSITINEDSLSKRALQPFETRPAAELVDGYRVGVYFDNTPQARSGAMNVVEQCNRLMPDIPTSMIYDNPYFKVSVGYAISEEEAAIMLNRVQRHFPKAYLLREKVSASDIVRAREYELRSHEIDTVGVAAVAEE